MVAMVLFPLVGPDWAINAGFPLVGTDLAIDDWNGGFCEYGLFQLDSAGSAVAMDRRPSEVGLGFGDVGML